MSACISREHSWRYKNRYTQTFCSETAQKSNVYRQICNNIPQLSLSDDNEHVCPLMKLEDTLSVTDRQTDDNEVISTCQPASAGNTETDIYEICKRVFVLKCLCTCPNFHILI